MYSGNFQSALMATVDVVLAINKKSWHELFFEHEVAPREPWSIVAGARSHLADAPMTSGDVDAYQHLGWVQERLFNAAIGKCSTEYAEERGLVSFCRNPSVTFCGSCGRELCLDCAEKCCMETFCEFCKSAHERAMHCDA